MGNVIFGAVKRLSSFPHLNFSFHISQFSYILRILAGASCFDHALQQAHQAPVDLIYLII